MTPNDIPNNVTCSCHGSLERCALLGPLFLLITTIFIHTLMGRTSHQ